jgi:hypothetical protein
MYTEQPCWPSCFIATRHGSAFAFCSAAAKERIDSFISRGKRCGYCVDNVPPVKELFADSHNSLFK